jgi:hypothetical protein
MHSGGAFLHLTWSWYYIIKQYWSKGVWCIFFVVEANLELLHNAEKQLLIRRFSLSAPIFCYVYHLRKRSCSPYVRPICPRRNL